ncbi:Hypothetical_protein [Hexamita inflata]|uniref:Hypothetical_protein n=1 Tax=Hexamita inflata TaxID=28002 RepID=A0AA86RWM5_9EUKA|nr:Hypothetical protein HINF_LOCUS36943 [Hexamita inflata]CAI9973955.1 Hypothetical protein HINF_LOCUS61600 [Hexamita inflata]
MKSSQRLKTIANIAYQSYTQLLEQSSQLGDLITKVNSRLAMKEKNYVEIEQFMFHIQKAGDLIQESCDKIIEQYKLAINDDFAVTLFNLSQYCYMIKSILEHNLKNLYKVIDPDLFDFRELNQYKEELKYMLLQQE